MLQLALRSWHVQSVNRCQCLNVTDWVLGCLHERMKKLLGRRLLVLVLVLVPVLVGVVVKEAKRDGPTGKEERERTEVSPRLDQVYGKSRQNRFRERKCDLISSVSETVNKPSSIGEAGGYVSRTSRKAKKGKLSSCINHARMSSGLTE